MISLAIASPPSLVNFSATGLTLSRIRAIATERKGRGLQAGARR